MIYRSRMGKEPTQMWVSNVLAIAQNNYPRADLDRAIVTKLWPHLRDLWQRGSPSEAAAAALFTCDGKQIRVNPLLDDPEPVRAPRGAKRGEPFGADEVRPAPPPKPRKPRQPSPPRSPQGQPTQAGCPVNHPACKLGVLGASCGLPATLVWAAAQGAPVPQVSRYCLTSADAIIPSHNPLNGFSPNPSYPEGVQERDYQRDKSEQLKVISIAQNMIPALIANGSPGAIDGLPVVTETGLVLGGNGRAMAIQKHYAEGGRVLADYLAENAAQFGFSRVQVEAIKKPIVVRTLETGKPPTQRELRELVRLLNIPLTQTLAPRSELVAEAQRLDPQVLDVLGIALAEPDVTLRDYLSTPQSRSLANALRRSGILTDNNAKRYYTADGFTEDGKTFVERLLTAALIPDAVLLDRAGGQLLGTLARSAPWLLSAASAGPAWDLRPALRAAVIDYLELRATGAASVAAFLRQTRIEGPPKSADNPTAGTLLEILFDLAGKPLAFARVARRYAELANDHPSAQGGLFAAEKLEPTQALQQARAAI